MRQLFNFSINLVFAPQACQRKCRKIATPRLKWNGSENKKD